MEKSRTSQYQNQQYTVERNKKPSVSTETEGFS
jgi:hypothetical protein